MSHKSLFSFRIDLDDPATTPEALPMAPRAPLPGRGPESSDPIDRFSTSLEAVRSSTESLALRRLLTALLAESDFIRKFPEDARPQWTEIIADLITLAKSGLQDASRRVDFYAKLRELKDAEEKKPVREKLLFIPRLAHGLTRENFQVHENGQSAIWKVELCSREDLESAAPAIQARNTVSGELKPQQLIYIMAGLKI